jgi:hypothetical protein
MNKFRASFSVLTVWEKGDWQKAVEMYFKLTDFTNRAMQAGKDLHEQFEAEIKKTNAMPQVFGGKKLGKVDTELKIVKQLDDWLELVGVIDCYDETSKTIYDWKTGQTPSERYVDSFQPKVYQILKPEAIKAEIHHYNQYNKKSDMSVLHLTDKTLDDAVNWVLTLSSEMHSYLDENKLYERFAQ